MMLGTKGNYAADIEHILEFRDFFEGKELKLPEFGELINYFFDRYVHESWENKSAVQKIKEFFTKSIARRLDDNLNKRHCPRDLIEELDNRLFIDQLESRGYDFCQVVEDMAEQGYITKQRKDLLVQEYANYNKYGSFFGEMNMALMSAVKILDKLDDISDDTDDMPVDHRSQKYHPGKGMTGRKPASSKVVVRVDFKKRIRE